MSNRATSPPNIVFLMPDQLRPDYLGCYGASFAGTPNIDHLASQGMLYERAISPSPICIPARASLQTGHNALSTGVLTNNFWLRPDHNNCGMPTLASLLTEVGYHTEAVGKMHFIPWDQNEGFAHRFIAEDKRHIHIQDDYAEYLAEHGLRKYAGPEEPGYADNLMASVSPIPLEHQIDVRIGEHATRFLDHYSGEKPFFLWVAFAGPHDPYNPPQEVVNIIENLDVPASIPATAESEVFRPGFVLSHKNGSAQVDFTEFPEAAKTKIRRHYIGLIRIIDEQVGKILRVLKQQKYMRDTIIVFSSDHGDFLGDFNMVGKALFYEPSIRIPLIVSSDSFECGRSQALVSLTDLFATFMKIAGVEPAAQDSIPLPGFGEYSTCRQNILGATGSGVMWLTDNWKLSRYKNGLATLHNVLDDPQEQHNRFFDPDCLEIRDKLDRQMMSELLQSVTEGHLEKSYPYMTMNPSHPGHRRNWNRPYPSNGWSKRSGNIDGWNKAGMPL